MRSRVLEALIRVLKVVSRRGDVIEWELVKTILPEDEPTLPFLVIIVVL